MGSRVKDAGSRRGTIMRAMDVVRTRREPITIWSFTDVFEVVCPFCSGRAKVVPSALQRTTRLTCIQCGKSKTRKPLKPGVFTSANALKWPKNHYAIGDAADPYFHLPLWLQTRCGGH